MTPAAAPRVFEAARARADVPILASRVRGRPLVYLDNAASTQKPKAVVERMRRFYADEYANIHRGVYYLSERATDAYEAARARVAAFVGGDAGEIVFTKGTTEAINLVAAAWGRANVKAGDEVVVTEMEHHSNIVPWQLLAESVGARVRVAPIAGDGSLDLDALDRLLTARTRLVAVAHVSNVLGTVNPIAEIARRAHAAGAKVLVDGAQGAPHVKIDVGELSCDFYAASGHKIYGPTGIGFLWARREVLEAMPPYHGGGEMIVKVAWDGTTYKAPPHRFEAGTPPIAEAIGLAEAIDWLDSFDPAAVEAHERALVARATEALEALDGVRVVAGPDRAAPRANVPRTGAVSFVVDGVHPHDVGTVLDREGVAIRAGHHCAQPLMARLGLPATARASFGLYNDASDVEALAAAVRGVREIFR